MKWLNQSSADTVRSFWEAVGEFEPYPRTLERPILLALPVVIVKLQKLTIQRIETWLSQRGAGITLGCSDRPLRGCLVVRFGGAFIFIDGTDTPDEQRFALAHEVGHYLAEYWIPRKKAIEKFGSQISDVFDGRRTPTVSERLGSMLLGVRLQSLTRLINRNDSFECENASVWEAESEADKIGLTLLAPPQVVLAQLNPVVSRYEGRANEITGILVERFGLPRQIARRYGAKLLAISGRGRSWTEHFR